MRIPLHLPSNIVMGVNAHMKVLVMDFLWHPSIGFETLTWECIDLLQADQRNPGKKFVQLWNIHYMQPSVKESVALMSIQGDSCCHIKLWLCRDSNAAL